MPLKRLGKPPFIMVADVEDGDVLTVVEAPYLVPAEKSKWGKERYRMVVKKDGDKEWGLRTWTLNVTTWNRLLDKFGEDEQLWLGKKVQVYIKEENIGGVQKTVLYGKPCLNSQSALAG